MSQIPTEPSDELVAGSPPAAENGPSGPLSPGGPRVRLWLVIVLVVVGLLVGGASTFLLTGGDDGQGPPTSEPDYEPYEPGGGGSSPEDAVDSFLAAAAEGDCDAAFALATDRVRDGLWESLCDSSGGFTHLERTEPASVAGSRALVEVEVTGDLDREGGGLDILSFTYVVLEGAGRDDGWFLDELVPQYRSEDPVPSSPGWVAEQFVTAAEHRDCQALLELVTASYLGGLPREEALIECEGGWQDRMEAIGRLQRVSNGLGNEDTVTVPLAPTEDDESASHEVTLVRHGDSWLVEGFGPR